MKWKIARLFCHAASVLGAPLLTYIAATLAKEAANKAGVVIGLTTCGLMKDETVAEIWDGSWPEDVDETFTPEGIRVDAFTIPGGGAVAITKVGLGMVHITPRFYPDDAPKESLSTIEQDITWDEDEPVVEEHEVTYPVKVRQRSTSRH